MADEISDKKVEGAEEKKVEKPPGPAAKALKWVQVIGAAVAIIISVWNSVDAKDKSKETEKKAKDVTNANATAIERVVQLLLKNDQDHAIAIGELRGLAVASIVKPKAVHIEAYKPKPRRKVVKVKPDAGAPKQEQKMDAGPPPKPAPRPPVKFQLRRMTQEQQQAQEEL